MEANFVVYVDSIVKNGGSTIVSASNGGNSGPPSVTWQILPSEIEKCHVGKRYEVSVVDA